MRAILLALLVGACGTACASAPVPTSSEKALTLRGVWTQGSLLVGHVESDSKVWFNGRALKVSPEGEFVLGLDRDEPKAAELKVQAPGAAPQIHRYNVAQRKYDIQRINGLKDAMVEPSPALQARIKNDQRRVFQARHQESAQRGFAQTFIWPATGRISGVFGGQRILNGVPKQPHYAVDVAGPIGTPVKAPADGIITLADTDFYLTGGTLVIDHGFGVSSTMIHLSKLHVKKGDVVKQGDRIADIGNTGRTTGPHLHWGISWYKARIDPQLLVSPMPGSEKQ